MMGVVLFGLVTMVALTLLYGIDLGRDLVQVNQNLSSETKFPVCSVQTEKQQMALSFDTVWGEGNIQEILAVLKRNGVKATFFVSGEWVEQYPDRVKEISEAGHELGSYGQSYADMRQLSDGECQEELMSVHNQVEKLTGYEMSLFRPPLGEYDNHVIENAERCGYRTVQGNVDSLDWKDYGVDSIIQTVLNHHDLGKGSIVIFRSSAMYTAEALEEIIAELQSRGFDLVPVSRLFDSK